jgi:hypothetical protein
MRDEDTCPSAGASDRADDPDVDEAADPCDPEPVRLMYHRKRKQADGYTESDSKQALARND